MWSENFDDTFFLQGLHRWLKTGHIAQDITHVQPFVVARGFNGEARIGRKFAREFRETKSIMGVFDEGCMGMYNAIIPDELLNPTGVFKERLSQSALYAKMQAVSDAEARASYDWLVKSGMQFHFGPNEATDLTENQVLQQCRMYIAAVRFADEFGCAAIGIQYQQGLKDLTPASDLAEGLLNNTSRPPVTREGTGEELYAGQALPHFNEVDECAGLDALVTNRLWLRLGFAPETTLHDLRWGRHYQGNGMDDFVWVLEISGAVPPEHFEGGYRGAIGERQPPMYFPREGGRSKESANPVGLSGVAFLWKRGN